VLSPVVVVLRPVVVVLLGAVLVDVAMVVVVFGDVVVVSPGTVVEVVDVPFTDVDVSLSIVVVVCSGAVVVDVDEHFESSRRSEALPRGAPSNVHEAVASTVCVPEGTDIAMVSEPVGPTNVKSRCAISTPSSDTVSCDVAAVISGKSVYTNSTRGHEMLIVLLCADAAVTNNDNNDAVNNIGTPTPMPTAACTRDHRDRFARMYCS
jgi:hypothetical protein